MILAHSPLGGNVAEHASLLLIGSSHAPLDAPCAVSLHNCRLFQQPAKGLLALMRFPLPIRRSGLAAIQARRLF